MQKIVRWYDTGAPPPSLAQAMGSAIPDTQISFGDEEGGGGDDVEGLSFSFSSLRQTVKLSILDSSFFVSSFIINVAWSYVGISPKRKGWCITAAVGISLRYETKVTNQ